MSRIIEISKMPTMVTSVPLDSMGVHESCLRAFNILREVKVMLKDNVPHKTIGELIEEMESGKGEEG